MEAPSKLKDHQLQEQTVLFWETREDHAPLDIKDLIEGGNLQRPEAALTTGRTILDGHINVSLTHNQGNIHFKGFMSYFPAATSPIFAAEFSSLLLLVTCHLIVGLAWGNLWFPLLLTTGASVSHPEEPRSTNQPTTWLPSARNTGF